MGETRAQSNIFPVVVADAPAPSALEREVVEHFDRMREPMLRYLAGFGLAMHDCEEVVQEAFLALFSVHLQRGRSRSAIFAPGCSAWRTIWR